MTVVAITGEQLNEAAEIRMGLNHLQGLVAELKEVTESYPFSREAIATKALEAKITADSVYKRALL